MAIRENPRRHLFLLIALLSLVVLAPLLSVVRHGIVFLNVIGAAVLLSALYAVSESKHVFLTAMILSIVSSLLMAYPAHVIVLVSHTMMITVLGFFAAAILSYVLRSG